jgi:hypothetical protein
VVEFWSDGVIGGPAIFPAARAFGAAGRSETPYVVSYNLGLVRSSSLARPAST